MNQIINATEIRVAPSAYNALYAFALMRRGLSFEEALNFKASDYWISRCAGCYHAELSDDHCWDCREEGQFEEWVDEFYSEVEPYEPQAPEEVRQDGLPSDYDPFADVE